MQPLLKPLLLSLLLLPCLTMAQADKEMPHYELELKVLPGQGKLEATFDLKVDSSFVKNGTLALFLNAQAQMEHLEANLPAEIKKEGLDEARDRIELTFPDLKEAEVVVRMKYYLEIPQNHPINRITEEWVELNLDSFWLPIISEFPRFNYKMQLHMDPSFTLLTGDIKVGRGQDGSVTIVNRLPRLDISFSAAKKLHTVAGEYVEVSAADRNTAIDSVKMLADQAMSFLDTYLDVPEDFAHKRKVVVSPREEVGYSRKNYVVLSEIEDHDALSLASFLSHEFSHYWFSEANIGSKHHWLTESFAEYLSMIFIREEYGEADFEADLEEKKKRIEGDPKALTDYEGRPSHLAMYFKGPLVLHGLEQYLGDEDFKLLLNAFVDRSISTNEELFGLLEEEFGKDAVLELKQLMADI